MLRKLFATVSMLCLLSVSTFAGNNEVRLSQAFDKYNFQVNVQWDQQDQAFLTKAKAELREEIGKLLTEGMKKEELLKFVSTKTKNPSLAKELESIMNSLKDSNLSEVELESVIMKQLSSTQADGSNYRGYYTTFSLIAAIWLVVWVSYEIDYTYYGSCEYRYYGGYNWYCTSGGCPAGCGYDKNCIEYSYSSCWDLGY